MPNYPCPALTQVAEKYGTRVNLEAPARSAGLTHDEVRHTDFSCALPALQHALHPVLFIFMPFMLASVVFSHVCGMRCMRCMRQHPPTATSLVPWWGTIASCSRPRRLTLSQAALSTARNVSHDVWRLTPPSQAPTHPLGPLPKLHHNSMPQLTLPSFSRYRPLRLRPWHERTLLTQSHMRPSH